MAKDTDTQLAVMATNIEYIKRDVQEVKESMEEIKKTNTDTFVSKVEFDPVKKLVFGMVALILTAVVGAIIALVVRK